MINTNTMGDKVEQDLKLSNNNNNNSNNNNDDEATSQTPLLLSQEVETPYDSLAAVVVRNDDSSMDGGAAVMIETNSSNNNGHAIGRALLLTVAFLYGTLNVVLRLLYSQPGPPSASVLSTTRGWLAVVCFLPFLSAQQQQQQQKRNVDQPPTTRRVRKERRENENELELELEFANNNNAAATHTLSQKGNGNVAASQETTLTCTSTAAASAALQKTEGPQQRVQFSPSVNTNPSSSRSRSFWKMAIELAVLNFGAQALINLGLLSVSSARAAFLTQTSVVLTPAVSALLGRSVHPKVWLACLVALGGLVLMSHEEGESGLGHFQVGDLLCLGGALSWSLYIFRLSYCEMFDEIELQAAKSFFLAVLYTAWFAVAFIQSETCLWEGWTSLVAWALLFYSALGPGTLADVMQQKGQGIVTAVEANVILSMEPVFTAIMGRLFLGEVTSTQDRFGGGLIILAALIATT